MAYYYISDGDTKKDIILNDNDDLYVHPGGTARRITINSGGSLYIESGGTATQIVENGGYVGFDYGASVTFLANTFSDLTLSELYATVHSGTTAIRTTIDSRSYLYVYSGGIAKSTTVNTGGYLWVTSGGTATNIHWTPCEGTVHVGNGAYATFADQLSGVYFGSPGQLLSHAKAMSFKHVNYIGYDDDTGTISERMYVMSGGTATDTIISGGKVEVWSSGVAKNTILYDYRDDDYWGGYDSFDIRNGGTASNTTINGGWTTVYSGGKATKVTINSGGGLDVYGGKADGIILNAGGKCEAGDGGTATILQWTPCEGDLSIYGGGKVIFTSKYSGVYIGTNDILLSHAKKSVTLKELELHDSMHIMSGGTADHTILRGGEMAIWNGGKANNTTVAAYDDEDYLCYGWVDVYSGGVASYTSIASSAWMNVYEGGTAFETTIRGGFLEIESGGKASGTTILQYIHDDYDDGRNNALYVSSGGVALSTTVGDGGYLCVRPGGIATDITLKAGSYLYVESGGMVGNITNLGGEFDYEDGAILNYVYKGGGITPVSSSTITVSEDADGGGNNWLYDKKTGETNWETTDSELKPVTGDTWEILVDAEAASYEDKYGNEYSNFVGYGDAVDFTRIDLETAARLSLTVAATDAAKITIWRLNETWKKNILSYSQKSLQSTKLALNKQTGLYAATTKPLLLEAGEYYVSVESTNAKKGGAAYYNVTVNQDASAFFDRGDNSDDWTDLKWNGYFSDEYGDGGIIDENTEAVIEDGWGGYGDAIDYARIHLDEAAKLSLLLDASDAAKFTIYRLNETVKKGVVSYSLKSLQSTTLKKTKGATEYTATTKSLLLNAGDYYIAMESTNAKKGGSADYNVRINAPGTAFFSDADEGWNNWLYDKKAKELNDEVVYRDPIEITPYTERVQVDAEAAGHEDANGTVWDNYVGYGDEYDFAKIRLESDARLNITITATDAAKFTVYALIEKVDSWTGIVSYKLETIQSSALKKAKGDSIYRYSVTMMVPGYVNYYVSMQSTNAAKGGCAYYNVEINQKKSSFEDMYLYAPLSPVEAEDAEALTMPETGGFAEDGLFARLELNSAQDASLSAVGSGLESTQDNLFWESGGGMLASL